MTTHENVQVGKQNCRFSIIYVRTDAILAVLLSYSIAYRLCNKHGTHHETHHQDTMPYSFTKADKVSLCATVHRQTTWTSCSLPKCVHYTQNVPSKTHNGRGDRIGPLYPRHIVHGTFPIQCCLFTVVHQPLPPFIEE